MKFKLSFAVLLVALGFTLPCNADTLTFTGVGGASVNGIYIYPYNFTATIGATTSSMQLMCVDFNREITFGESWKVTENAISATDTSQMGIDLRALALISFAASTNYLGYSVADYQFAAWNIFDPGVNGNSGLTPLATTLSSAAEGLAAGNGALPPGFAYENYAFYTPTLDMTGWTMGAPQRFIGGRTPGFVPNISPPNAPSPTPEPSGLVLLGTGIFSAAGMMYRRVRA